MSTEQVIAPNTISSIALAQECPICMDTIDGLCNRVVTECGHIFHCSCLMQNAAHNGFGCPYCRSKMADEPEEEEEDNDEEGDLEDATVFDEDALTSFRMFHQQINGEEVEEEPAEEWESVDGSDDGEDEEEEGETGMPDAAYMAQKLSERGITMEDLVKNILFQEHSSWGDHYSDYERRSSEVYGQFRAVISQYTPPEPTPTPSNTNIPPASTETHSIAPPTIAESKSVSMPYRRREFMVHV